MDVKRYIEIQAIKLSDNTLIPVWDSRLKYDKTEMYGPELTIEGDYKKHFVLVSAILDLKTKNISMGMEIDFYPDRTEFNVNDKVYYEAGFRTIKESKVAEINFENFEVTIVRGKKIEPGDKEKLKVEINPDLLYAIKYWKPCYVLKDGFKTEWSHKLYHKA